MPFKGRGQCLLLAAGILALWTVHAFAQAQVGESFGVALDPAQKNARQFHGGFYHLTRSSDLDARSFFDSRVEPYSYRDFRFALTGPLRLPRPLARRGQNWFFSWGLGWNGETRPETRRGIVPTAAERAGDFRGSPLCTEAFRAQFADCRVPAESWSVSGPQLLAPYPLPNAEGVIFNLVREAARTSAVWQHSLQLEYAPKATWKASLRLARDTVGQSLPFQGSVLGNAPVMRRRSSNAASLRLTAALSPKSVNAFSVTLTGVAQSDRSLNRLLNRHDTGYLAPELFPENPAAALPAVNVAGFSGFNAGRGSAFSRRSVTVRNDYSRTFKAHELKVGVLWMRSSRVQESSALPAGSVSFSASGGNSTGNAVADALLGRFASYQEGRAAFANLVFDQFEITLGGKWKWRPRIAVEYGFTYFRMPAERSAGAPLANFVPWRFDRAGAWQVSDDGTLGALPATGWNGIVWEGSGAPRGLYGSGWRDFAPRGGFSWQPFKKKKLTFRASGGATFDRPRLDVSTANSPWTQAVTRLAGRLEDPASATQPPSRPPSLAAVHPDFRNPTVYSGNARMEQELGRLSLAGGYKFSLGRHLLRQRNLNQLLPGTLLRNTGVHPDALRPFPGYGTILWREAGANSSFHALELSATARKPVAGFTYSVRYTFSKTLTDSTAEGESQQDHFNLRNERGAAGLDRRQVLVFQYSLQPAIGKWAPAKWMPAAIRRLFENWEISGVSTFSTGRPFDVTLTGDPARMGGGVQRPDVLASPRLPRSERTLDHYFNTDVFRSPATGLLGNAARHIVFGPGTNNFNFSAARTVAFSAKYKGELRAQVLNAFNHASFSTLGAVFNPETYGLPSSTFGRVTAAGPGRSVQLSFKVTF